MAPGFLGLCRHPGVTMAAMFRLVLVFALTIATLSGTSAQPDLCAEQRVAYVRIVEAGANSGAIAEFEAARDALAACMGVGPAVMPTPTNNNTTP